MNIDLRRWSWLCCRRFDDLGCPYLALVLNALQDGRYSRCFTWGIFWLGKLGNSDFKGITSLLILMLLRNAFLELLVNSTGILAIFLAGLLKAVGREAYWLVGVSWLGGHVEAVPACHLVNSMGNIGPQWKHLEFWRAVLAKLPLGPIVSVHLQQLVFLVRQQLPELVGILKFAQSALNIFPHGQLMGIILILGRIFRVIIAVVESIPYRLLKIRMWNRLLVIHRLIIGFGRGEF